MVGRDDLAYAVGIAFGVVLLVMSGYADRSPEIVMHNDFAVLWGGSRTILDGGTPYDPAAFVATTSRYGTERPPIYNSYTYPGWVAVALIPFALLPVPVASAIWTIGGALAAVVALRLLLRRYCRGVPVIHTLAGLTLFASQPGRLTVILGQWGFVLLAASAAAVALLSGGQAGRAGASASVFLAKPQPLVAAAVGLAAAAVTRGHARRFMLAALGIAAFALAVSLAVLPGWPAEWRSTVPGALLPIPPQTTTTFALLYGVFGPPGVAIAVGVIVAGALMALLFRPESDAWLAMWLALSPVAAVYAWSYDHILVIVPLIVATGVALRRSRRVALAATLAWTLLLDIGTIALAVVAARRDNESYSAVIPLIAFALVTVLVWPERRFKRGSVRSSAPRTGSSP